ncbi:MAG: tRNA (adenosine(37)-N6)-dimethylallyltransferase MiaA [Bacteroidetes bacterium]|nr:MAG: tRNA (adenosine(37)-N6)-dimethylallyltransferase MiaA [Bacteroidota bacterium]
MSNYLISIVGPTAIGKTTLSIKLAKHFDTEIISADSRQFYKEMQIGTAAPSLEELSQAKHHFIHHKSVDDNYNAGNFEKDALELLDNLFKKHAVVIMVGGSGLYIDAVTKGLDEFPEVHSSIREKLNKELIKNGLTSLQNKLKELDEVSYHKISIENPHRVIRALEICLSSDKPYSYYLDRPKTERNFKTISIGLSADRNIIYDRINKRVDLMMQEGLLNEVETLKGKKKLNTLNTVGYKELFKYLNNECDLDFAISEIKKNTRRFAKRQITWFKKDESMRWFDQQYELKEITDYIKKKSS